MMLRRAVPAVLFIFLAAGYAPAAVHQTRNFTVHAPNDQLARQFGQAAEQYRKQKAQEWLGYEMPPWPAPCPLYVKPNMRAGGATKFNYPGNGAYEVMSMEISGDVERMMNSVLPHEVTHTVFAHHFRYPVPRWADEGGAVLSEDETERKKHDQLCRNMLNAGQKFPLRRLFMVKEYEEVSDVMVIYAEGYSICNYLVGISNRQTFLSFVATGMRQGWDRAVQTYYRMNSVDELEIAWLKHLRETKNGNPNAMMANNTNGNRPQGTTASREVVRMTVPPAQPVLDPAGPVARGQAEEPARLPIITLGLPEFGPAPKPKPAGPPSVGFQN